MHVSVFKMNILLIIFTKQEPNDYAAFSRTHREKKKTKNSGKALNSNTKSGNLETHNQAYSWSQSCLAGLTKGSVSWMSSFKEL